LGWTLFFFGRIPEIGMQTSVCKYSKGTSSKGEIMNPLAHPEPQPTPLQERPLEIIEDTSLPAEQILKEQSEQENRPTIFVP
jgi:hypothetical protein